MYTEVGCEHYVASKNNAIYKNAKCININLHNHHFIFTQFLSPDCNRFYLIFYTSYSSAISCEETWRCQLCTKHCLPKKRSTTATTNNPSLSSLTQAQALPNFFVTSSNIPNYQNVKRNLTIQSILPVTCMITNAAIREPMNHGSFGNLAIELMANGVAKVTNRVQTKPISRFHCQILIKQIVKGKKKLVYCTA